MEAKQFINNLHKAVKAYQKACNETYDDVDAAHFYPDDCREFLIKYKDEITQLSTIKFNQYFAKWVNLYIYKNAKVNSK